MSEINNLMAKVAALEDSCERLQAELREARENLSDEKQHSDFMENLVAARHGAGWEQLTIDAANNVRESAERLLQEQTRKAEVYEFQYHEAQMQMAGLVDALAYYATTRDCYVEKAEGVWLLAEKALANLPDVSKYRRLMEAVEKGHWRELADWLDMKFPDDANPEIQRDLRELSEAFRAIKERT